MCRLTNGFLIGLVAFIVAWPLRGSGQETPAPEDVLAAATQVGEWLASHSKPEKTGISWPDDALGPDTASADLGSGIPGKVLFFLALHRATGDERWLALANGGADYLVAVLDDAAAFAGNPRRASLYSGIGGIPVALLNLEPVERSAGHSLAIERSVFLLDEWHMADGDRAYWSDEFNDLLYGEAGTVLLLSYIADRTGSDRALALAQAGARFLVSEAQPAATGSYWLFRRGRDFNLPNFSHGTAGIGYTLASLAAISSDQVLARAAADAFRYLESITVAADGNQAIPYGWGLETWDGLYEFGWAHGVAGSALFLQRLAQQPGDDAQALSAGLRNTLTNINLPGEPGAPFAAPSTALDMRFGRAGVLALLSEWSRHDSSVVATRDAIFRHLLHAAADGDTIYWETAVPEFMGGGRARYTGYLHGAAGIGLAMLKMHAAMTGAAPYVVMPDDPFSWTPGRASD